MPLLEFKSQERERLDREHKELEAKSDSILNDVKVLQQRRASLPADSPEIAGIDKALAAHQQAFTDLYHPTKNPNAFQNLGRFLEKHILRKQPAPLPPSNAVTPERMAGLEASAAGTQATPPFLTPDEARKAARIHAGIEPSASKAEKSSDYSKSLRRFVEDQGGDPENPTFEEEQAFRNARKQKKGFKYDAATGQAVDQDSGARFSQGDPNAPPEANAMFKGAEAVLATKQQYAERLAKIRGASYGMNRGYNVLDSQNGNAPAIVSLADIKNSPGRYQPAGPAQKALAQENLFQDIIGTSQLTRQSIENLKTDFPSDAKVKIALAMKADDPHSAIDQLVASGALGALTPDQQDFLIATRQLTENAMAMRTILGAGQGSEDMRSAIRATLPNLLSPDRSYAIRQLDAFDKTIARLHRGVPRVTLSIGDMRNNAASTAGKAPAVGTVVDGYRFKGGDPSVQSNWEKVK